MPICAERCVKRRRSASRAGDMRGMLASVDKVAALIITGCQSCATWVSLQTNARIEIGVREIHHQVDHEKITAMTRVKPCTTG